MQVQGETAMEIELNHLIAQFAQVPFKVQGVYRLSIEPGTAGWEKTAPYPGMIFPLKGQAQYHFDGTPYLAKAGTVILGGADMHLDKKVLGNSSWEFICVLYELYGPEKFASLLPKLHTELTVGYSPRLTELLHRLWETRKQPEALRAFQQEWLFRCVLDDIFVCARNRSDTEAKALFERASAYIREYYMEPLSIRALAQQHGVDENRLYYVFQKYGGMGAGQYLTTYRLNCSREMLEHGKASISEIAKSVGYSDPLYFSRAFRKHFGLSPSSARKIQE